MISYEASPKSLGGREGHKRQNEVLHQCPVREWIMAQVPGPEETSIRASLCGPKEVHNILQGRRLHGDITFQDE